jgi:TonB family protein
MPRAKTLALTGLMVVVCATVAPEASARTKKRTIDRRNGAPFSLTASDGTGLRLVSLRARVVVDGPLAFTELHLTFRNPQNRQREGRFQITLPPTAAISRFAMKIDGRWQEGEVVERQRARKIYESYLHVNRDPALLEKKAGNTFRARIFPIAARANKELRISYSEELVSTRKPYRLRLRGLPRIGRVRIRALVHRRVGRRLRWRHHRLSKRRYFPRRDFTLALPSGVRGLRHGNLAVLRVTPRISTSGAALTSLLILLDTSASAAPGFPAQVARLGQLVRALRRQHGRRIHLRVAAFDQTVQTVYVGSASGFSGRHLKRLLARGALGASNLEAALGWAARQRGYRRLLLITDGVATAGGTGIRLNHALRRAHRRIQRLDVLATGSTRDESRLRDLVTGVLKHDGVLLDDSLRARDIAERMSQSVRSRVRVSVPGARWVWPQHLDSLQSGSEALIYVKLPSSPQGQYRSVTVRLSGRVEQTQRVVVHSTQRPLLERAWMGARIRWLSNLGDNAILRSQIVGLSKRHRVLSEHTALLVLETAADYRAHGLRRGALSNILTVGRRGVVLNKRSRGWLRRHVHRGRSRTPSAGQPPASSTAQARITRRRLGRNGFWNLAFRSRGRALSPSVTQIRRNAEHRRVLAQRSGRPRVFASRVTVSGGLDASSIRRIIRRHLSQIRFCFVSIGLPDNPTLAGMVKVAFTIASAGNVGSVAIAQSTLNHTPTERCIKRAVQQWKFPKPPGSMPYIVYPFHFTNRNHPRSQPTRAKAAKPPAARRSHTPKVVAKPKPVLLRNAYSGELLRVKRLLRAKKTRRALARARKWRTRSPGSLPALIGLGEALQALGRRKEAARAYGSIIDLFPSRAELRRYAGNQLAALGRVGLRLAKDTYAKAVAQRPDHPHGYRLLAYTQVRLAQPLKGLETLETALSRAYPSGRFAGAKRVLRADLGIVARVLVKRSPRLKPALVHRLAISSAKLARGPSTRAVLTWETDANNVDLGVSMGKGTPLFAGSHETNGAYDLYNNITNGFGPECIVFNKGKSSSHYGLHVRYTTRGSMGYGLGMVQVLHHDGRGGLRFDDRPFVIMKEGATVTLGKQ